MTEEASMGICEGALVRRLRAREGCRRGFDNLYETGTDYLVFEIKAGAYALRASISDNANVENPRETDA